MSTIIISHHTSYHSLVDACSPMEHTTRQTNLPQHTPGVTPLALCYGVLSREKDSITNLWFVGMCLIMPTHVEMVYRRTWTQGQYRKSGVRLATRPLSPREDGCRPSRDSSVLGLLWIGEPENPEPVVYWITWKSCVPKNLPVSTEPQLSCYCK